MESISNRIKRILLAIALLGHSQILKAAEIDTNLIRLNLVIKAYIETGKSFSSYEDIYRKAKNSKLDFLANRGFKDVDYIKVTIYNRKELYRRLYVQKQDNNAADRFYSSATNEYYKL